MGGTKYIYHSPLGLLSVTCEGSTVTGLVFTEETETQTTSWPNSFLHTKVCRWLDQYFSGEIPDFLPPLAPAGTPFQQRVWSELLKIPFGHTITYGELARQVDCRSAQAIGQAVGHNPIAILIPCHRVVGHNNPGGYAYGIERKRHLLLIEKTTIQ